LLPCQHPRVQMGSCLGACAGAAATSACFTACSCACLAPPLVTNLIYCLLFTVGTVAALVLRYYDQPMAICLDPSGGNCEGFWSDTTSFSYSLCGNQDCAGQWAVYRISFVLFCLFVVLFALTAYPSKCAVYVHRGYWFAKFFILAAVLVGTLFAPSDMFAYYAWVARFIAPAYLLYQLVCFIDFGYAINQRWVDNDEAEKQLLCFNNSFEDGGRLWKGLLVVSSLLLYGASITGVALLYRFYPSSCAFNALGVTVTLFMFLLNTVISLSKIAEHGSLFCSALITAYCVFLCYSAMASMPYEECNPFLASENTFNTVVSIGIACWTMIVKSFGVGNRHSRGQMADGVANDQVAVEVPGEAKDEVEPASYWKYNGVMVLLSVYMAMLLTAWGEDVATTGQGEGSSSYSAGLASAWIQMATNWLCSILYLWTLIAPRLFPDREFG